MPQRLNLVFGGELVHPQRSEFGDPSAVDMVGVFPDYATAAWKGRARSTADSTHTRYFSVHIDRLREKAVEAGPTEELG